MENDIPVLDKGERFQNTFGCYEMENTAMWIFEQIQKEGKWDIDIDYEDCPIGELKGLLMLAAGGWLEMSYPNGCFTPNEGFKERILKSLPIVRERRHLDRKDSENENSPSSNDPSL